MGMQGAFFAAVLQIYPLQSISALCDHFSRKAFGSIGAIVGTDEPVCPVNSVPNLFQRMFAAF